MADDVYLQSILILLSDAHRSNMSVGIVEQLKEALVDHVLSHIHQKQWHHVLPQIRDKLDVLPPECYKYMEVTQIRYKLL